MLTQERLREVLIYNEETGEFCWRLQPKGSKSKVGCDDKRYVRVRIDRVLYYGHQLAWFYVHGVWPKMIDHIDGNGRNNRLGNLRLSTSRLNGFNRRFPGNGTYWDKKLGKWRVQLGGRWPHREHIGVFDTKKEALAARQAALVKIVEQEEERLG